MNYKAFIKKQSTIIAIAVICLTVATMEVSYALFFQVETNSNNQIVKAGSLDVSYGSGSTAISAKELVPMSDDEALSSSTMTGTIYIENAGTLPAYYEVKLGNDTETFNSRENASDTDELLSHDYIRIAAYLDGEIIVEPTTLADIAQASDDETMHSLFKRVLDTTGTGGTTATIVLKVWISENAPEDIIGDFVYLKMDVTSEVSDIQTATVEDNSLLTLNASSGNDLLDYKIYGNSIQKGDPSPSTPVEIQSVGDLITDTTDANFGKYKMSIKVSGKNLVDIEDLPVGVYYNNYSVYLTKPVVVSAVDVPTEIDGNHWRLRFKLQDGTYLYAMDKKIKEGGAVVNISADNPVISIQARGDQIVSGQYSNIQIEYGTEATDYEPYVEPITTNVFLNEPLRKIGDVSDYIDFENKKVFRNIGQVIYDGSQSWSYYNSSIGYMIANTIFLNGEPVICNLLKNSQINIKNLAIRKQYNNIYTYGVADYYATVDEWEAFLTTTNMEVIGKLATPIEETIELPHIPTFEGSTVIDVNTSVTPSKATVSYNTK